MNDKKEMLSAVQSESSQVMSFDDRLKLVMLQVDFNEAITENPFDEQLYYQLCKIIAEVMNKPDNVKYRINKELISASKIKEVFALIRQQELNHVIERFREIDYPVRSQQAYLIAALYNAVFESESAQINEIYCDMPYLARKRNEDRK